MMGKKSQADYKYTENTLYDVSSLDHEYVSLYF